MLSMSSLKFSSTIRLVSRAEYDAHITQDLFDNNESTNVKNGFAQFNAAWTIEARVNSTRQAHTDKAWGCTISGFTNLKRIILFHLLPKPMEEARPLFNKIRAVLFPEIQPDPATQQNPNRAFSTGGLTTRWTCKEWIRFLIDYYKEEGIPHSLIWGGRRETKSFTHAYYNVASDTWIINSQYVTDLEKVRERQVLEPFSRDILTPEELKEHFSLIHIAEGDELIINGKAIPREEVNQDWVDEDCRAAEPPATTGQ